MHPDDPLVDATPLVPGLVLDLRYATPHNAFREAVLEGIKAREHYTGI